MLFYLEVALSELEVPNENSICIYISGCQNSCPNCHYPELQLSNYGDLLSEYYQDILDLYHRMASCVCFLGEGNGTVEEQEELRLYSKIAHQRNLKTCLYSGRDTAIEQWMDCFDYIKTGSYKSAQGPLDSPFTNQRMYQKTCGVYEDITKLFQ